MHFNLNEINISFATAAYEKHSIWEADLSPWMSFHIKRPQITQNSKASKFYIKGKTCDGDVFEYFRLVVYIFVPIINSNVI